MLYICFVFGWRTCVCGWLNCPRGLEEKHDLHLTTFYLWFPKGRKDLPSCKKTEGWPPYLWTQGNVGYVTSDRMTKTWGWHQLLMHGIKVRGELKEGRMTWKVHRGQPLADAILLLARRNWNKMFLLKHIDCIHFSYLTLTFLLAAPRNSAPYKWNKAW